MIENHDDHYLAVTPPSLLHDCSSQINKVSEPTTKPKSHLSDQLPTPKHTKSEDNEEGSAADDDEILIVEVQLG